MAPGGDGVGDGAWGAASHSDLRTHFKISISKAK